MWNSLWKNKFLRSSGVSEVQEFRHYNSQHETSTENQKTRKKLTTIMRKTILLAVLLCLALGAAAQQTSVAGFYPLENSGRIVYNFNEGWRFHLGDAPNAESLLFDDSSWEVVCAPHPARL